MAYGLYCTIPFTSLNGTSCQIQIWRDGYSGAVSTISPDNPSTRGYAAEDPFYFEEDSDHDLLKFIRVKTGYIRLIEKDNDSLSFLYPTREMQHYVRVYYGAYNSQQPLQNLVFTGYMRCQEFSNDWVAPPAVREFPVISPLGMAASKKFETKSPQLITVGSVLAEVMAGLSSNYKYVIWPGGQVEYEGQMYGALYPWYGKIHSTAVCPFNGDWNNNSTASDIYAPRTFEWFLDGMCACNGWMLHDTPDALVFTSFDNLKYYDRLTIEQLNNIPSSSEQYFNDSNYSYNRRDIDDYFDLCGDDGKLSESKPLEKLIFRVNGVEPYNKTGVPQLVNNLVSNSEYIHDNDKYVVDLHGNYAGPDVVSDNWADSPRNYGLYPGGFAPINIEAGTAVGTKVSAGSPSLTWMFKKTPSTTSGIAFSVRFYGPVTSSWSGKLLLRQTVRIGETLDNMKTIEEWYADGHDYRLAKANLSGSGDVSITAYNPTTEERIQMAAQLTDVDGDFYTINNFYMKVIDYLSVSVGVTSLSQLPSTCYISYEFSLIDPSNYERNASNSAPKSEVVMNNSYGPGIGEKTIDCNITDFSTMLCPASYGNNNGGFLKTYPPSFDYIFVPQTFLEVPFEKNSSPLDTNIYLPRWNYWKDSTYHWRIIGVNFHPRDDEYRITLAHTDNITPTS